MRLQEIKARLEKLSPEPWELYKCDEHLVEEACGLNGRSFDCSYDECHHPLDINEGEFIAHSKADIQYLINLVEAMRAEEPNFWDLYDSFQDKIAEKLKLKDEVKRHETMWKDLKSDAEITKDWRLYRVCSVALREVE